ncbi:MAG TPA: PfkB family carbohydrate kinase, partial [Chitinophagaceae bacterium]|nr:PfkB family carbohydrate kinase [Chitinophagaceae bacterium]
PGTATAFEFNDGKIMMAQMAELNSFGWDKLKTKIDIDILISLYKQSDLLCLLNWSEIDVSTDIWKGLLKDVLPQYAHKNQIAFFDLSDCSKRSAESITEALQLITEFAKYTKVVLSLNKNEAGIIYQTLFNAVSKKDLFDTGRDIFEKSSIHMLVLHSAKEVAAFTKKDSVSVQSFFISDPKISTGAGDNFNAGFCAAQLLELDLESSAIFANAVSGYYVRTGTSAQLPAIIHFLEAIQ